MSFLSKILYNNSNLGSSPHQNLITPKKAEMEMFRLKREDEEFSSLTKLLRKEWLEKLERGYQKSGQKYSIYCNFGELGSIDILSLGYQSPNCGQISVIVGPKIKSVGIKAKLIELLEKQEEEGKKAAANNISFQPKINIAVLQDRPTRHSYLMEKIIVYEDPHEPTLAPEWVTVVLNPPDEVVDDYIKRFHEKLKCAYKEIKTPSDVKKLHTYA